jgi:hypothetical protein
VRGRYQQVCRWWLRAGGGALPRSSTSLISLAWSGAANGDPHASAKAAAAAEAIARPPREATAAGASASYKSHALDS